MMPTGNRYIASTNERLLDARRDHAPSANDLAGMAWWNNLRPFDRAYWLSEAGSAAPVDAWNAYQQKQRLLELRWGAQ